MFGLLSAIFVIASPEHRVCAAGKAEMVGVGFTTTLTVNGLELQLSSVVAVMVKTVVCGEFVVLVKLPEIVGPLPVVPIPVTLVVLSLVQL